MPCTRWSVRRWTSAPRTPTYPGLEHHLAVPGSSSLLGSRCILTPTVPRPRVVGGSSRPGGSYRPPPRRSGQLDVDVRRGFWRCHTPLHGGLGHLGFVSYHPV